MKPSCENSIEVVLVVREAAEAVRHQRTCSKKNRRLATLKHCSRSSSGLIAGGDADVVGVEPVVGVGRASPQVLVEVRVGDTCRIEGPADQVKERALAAVEGGLA